MNKEQERKRRPPHASVKKQIDTAVIFGDERKASKSPTQTQSFEGNAIQVQTETRCRKEKRELTN